ncbi:MAG: GNAT family N-acetyltransferase [Planctomycetes bacterium]|nr:GNAT family N-acetyltransferase [Planctomycetota bacterium]
MQSKAAKKIKILPLIPQRWDDFERLFGQKGACGGCWCMWWKLKRSDFEKKKGRENKKAMKRIINSGQFPGLLAYHQNEPIGWCSVSKRDSYPVLERSWVLKRIDSEQVWSIVCFYIRKDKRRLRVSERLLREAINYVKRQRGKILEGYPIEPKKKSMPDVFAWVGLASSFRKIGFTEAARRSETRPIMRYYIK